MKHLAPLLIALIVLHGPACSAAEPTVVRITDKVLVKETIPLGIHHNTGDGMWQLPTRNLRVADNFEGGLHRWIYLVGSKTNTDAAFVVGMNAQARNRFADATYTLISGPSKWKTGKVQGISQSEALNDRGETMAMTRIDLDEKLPLQPGNGILLHKVDNTGQASRAARLNMPEASRFEIGDTPPDSFGQVSLRVLGSEKPAEIYFIVNPQNHVDNRGLFHVRFWAKPIGSNPSLRVHTRDFGQERRVKLEQGWKHYQLELELMNLPPDTDEYLYPHFCWEVSGGDVLLDEIEIERAGKINPTEMRDEMVLAVRRIGPGVIRALQGSNNTFRNTIAPRLDSYDNFGSLHRFYQFCQEVGARPYYCLPSTLTREEIRSFMEYLGAPADVGMGKLRARLGHPEPWTSTLKGICIEFGNELYNFGGYGGPDYWHDLIEAGKASPHYDPEKVFFTMGHQGDALDYARNSDGFSVGGYICWGFTKQQYQEYLSTDRTLFHWAYAWALREVLDPESRQNRQYKRARQLGIELAMYEDTYHTNFGNGPSEPRNRLVTSVAGGVNYVNRMLLQLKHHAMRRQCMFTAIGRGLSFGKSGAFGSSEAGFVRVWGNIIKLDSDDVRIRPGYLALEAVNHVVSGDLLQTVHEGPQPTFSFTGTFPNIRDLSRNREIQPETLEDLPLLFSYAFARGTARGLVLVNLELSNARPVQLEFFGKVAGSVARKWWLASDDPAANNELEHEAQVHLKEALVQGFSSGSRVSVPPHSLVVLEWQAVQP